MRLSICTLLILFSFLSCHSQTEKLIVSQKPIDDLSKYPAYKHLTEEKEGEIQWKKQYAYLDSIDMYGITYMSDGLKIRGYLVKPKKEGNYPCIIYNRGGNDNKRHALLIHSAATRLGELAKEGYVVIASQYRGGGGSEGKDEFGGADVNDVTILTEVLKEVEGADTERIGMFGWSRGGLMTYLALMKTDKIKAAVVGGAVSDSHATIEDRPEMETGVYSRMIPNYETNKVAELDKRTPIKQVDKFPKNVPILMLHGNSDWRVKSEQSIRMSLEFEKHRIPYRLVILEGGDHALSQHSEERDRQTLAWFHRFLKDKEAVPDMEYKGR